MPPVSSPLLAGLKRPMIPMPDQGDPASTSPDSRELTPPVPTTEPAPDVPAADAGQPIDLTVHIKALPTEVEGAIQVLQKAGMNDFAAMLQKAIGPKTADEQSGGDLQGEIEAMGHNPHGG